MHKSKIRTLKSHYQERWAVFRHNQKNTQKILLVQDQFVIKNLVPGDTLCYDCLGEMYQNIIPNLSTTVADKKYNNLILINNIEFKYKTIHELTECLTQLSEQLVLPGGRVVLSFEHRFLIYDRVGTSVLSLIDNWLKSLHKFTLVSKILLLGKSPYGYGDYFFCLQYRG
jgi:hypothetical protein